VNKQLGKWILTSCAGVVCLAVFLGYRGSSLAKKTEVNELERSLNTEIQMGAEVFESRLNLFASDIFNIVSAEYFQHNSKTPGVTPELADSNVMGVAILEQKGNGFEPDWLSLQPKSRDLIPQDFLRSVLPELQPSLKQMGRHFFSRALDAKQIPVMIFFSRIELPGSGQPALAVALMAPTALKLGSTTLKEGLVWDQKGFIWSYKNPAYVGAALKEEPLVSAALDSNDDTGRMRFTENHKTRIGAFSRIPETNLYLGVHHAIPTTLQFAMSWWISLLMGVLAASLISFGMFYRMKEDVEKDIVWVDEDELAPKTPTPYSPRPLVPEGASEQLSFIENDNTDQPATATETLTISEPTPALVFVDPSQGVLLEPIINRALSSLRSRCIELDVNVQVRTLAGLHVGAKAAQLQTALEEILKNSLDAMETVEDKNLIIEALFEGEVLKITISDTGIGIPAANHEKIFEPFFTTKTEESRGLGLTVVKRMLEFVDGAVKVESETGRGTKFSLLIPKPGEKLPATEEKISTLSAEGGISTLGENDDLEEAEEFSFAGMLAADVNEAAGKKVEIRKPQVRMFD
jgi:anti-sigma regulatory factor (Ser/Thr protein kinase)